MSILPFARLGSVTKHCGKAVRRTAEKAIISDRAQYTISTAASVERLPRTPHRHERWKPRKFTGPPPLSGDRTGLFQSSPAKTGISAVWAGDFQQILAKVAVLTAPGLPEAIWFKLCRHGRLFQHGVVALLGFGRRDVADGLQEPSVVEPVDPFQRRELDGLEAAPWPAPMDHLGLVETVDGFGESIVIGILRRCRQKARCLLRPGARCI